MKRRDLLRSAALAALPLTAASGAAPARLHRTRPGKPGWPDKQAWDTLARDVGGRLTSVDSPLVACRAAPDSNACTALFRSLRNPYYIGDTVGLTQTLGWADAWTSAPSAYAVTAESSQDVAAAVDFARTHRLRLVVRGGGHSYLGTSNAPDSLLVWTRHMNRIDLHDAFVPQGCTGPGEPAVSAGAGAIWMQMYDAVTTKGGRYVQGGGCTTVGVAGLVQSGGFGSFSKAFGTAAASLLEAEVVTADGQIRIANRCTNPELFWALKGGGGGSFGVVTRLTLRTHTLPAIFGAVHADIAAHSDAAYRRLVAKLIGFYREALFNPHWGEQIRFDTGNRLSIQMLFQDLSEAQARVVWAPFFQWVSAAGKEYTLSTPRVLSIPAAKFWDATVLRKVPGIVTGDDRPGAPAGNIFWTGDGGQVGWFIHHYLSAWLPATLLEPARQDRLVDALVARAQIWTVSLHFNKGLAGAPADALAATADTATNPALRQAFALVIVAGGEPPAYPGIAGHEPDMVAARSDAATMRATIAPLQKLIPAPASYLSESDYFDPEWRRAYWGANYQRLLAAKRLYDPDGLFIVHHGVGSDAWSPDGFTRTT